MSLLKKTKFSLFFISLLAGFFFTPVKAQNFQDARFFQPAEMQQDFTYLRKALEDTHPGLYMHHTKKALQFKMDSLYNLLNKPMIFFDFYRIIAYLVAEVKCEHTYSNPYGDDYNKRMMQWKLIPMQLFFTNNKAYVTVNRTADTSIHLGYEVLSVNGYPIDSIKYEIYKYIPADGNMESSKETMISNMSFNVYYYLFIERPDTFELTFKNLSGHVFTRRFATALSLHENDKLTLTNPANKQIILFDKRSKKMRNEPWRLKLIRDKNTAIITIRTFGGDREKLFKSYDKFFTTLQKEKIGNLIIDLSYNDGGEEEYACELLSYLIRTPTRFIESEYLINTDETYLKLSNLPKDVLQNLHAFIDTIKEGRIYAKELTKYTLELKTFDPKPNGFYGKVYFYVNGGTSSAASTCAANAQSHHLARIIGNETAGCFAGGGTTNGLELLLPNSRITAHTSIVYCKFSTSGKDKDRGVIPDYYFIPDFHELIGENNSWKEFIFDLIKTNNH